jgi:queuine tRNA-ribosyltransferase
VLGIADPRSIPRIVVHGADTFDSCYPTRVARHGTLLTRNGPLHIGQGKYKRQFVPIDEQLDAEIDAEINGGGGGGGGGPLEGVTRAYLHHLRVMKEPLYDMLASMHNLRYMTRLMAELRGRILRDEV